MARRSTPAEAPDSGARDAARAKRSKLVVDSQLAEEAQMKATIAAVEARIDSFDNTPAGVTVKGNQGRP